MAEQQDQGSIFWTRTRPPYAHDGPPTANNGGSLAARGTSGYSYVALALAVTHRQASLGSAVPGRNSFEGRHKPHPVFGVC